MSFNPFKSLGRLRRGEMAMVLEIDDDGRVLTTDRMLKQGSILMDKIQGKEYAIVTPTHDLVVKRTIKAGKHRVHIVDPQAGCSVDVKKGEDVIELSCTGRCELVP